MLVNFYPAFPVAICACLHINDIHKNRGFCGSSLWLFPVSMSDGQWAGVCVVYVIKVSSSD